jgi:MFS transporter, AAHS family, 4-hydroxybenzoate transporter
MTEGTVVDVARLIDDRRVGAFNIFLVALAFLIIISDGYDIAALAFAAPHLIREWHIASRSELGPVISASLFGILFGSPLLGYVGDRYGRKTAVIASCLIFGAFTFVAAWATSLSQLFYLRFLAGIGIGGLMPNLIALTGEFAPRRYRATMIIVMFCGVTLGGAVPGAINAWMVPHFGWPALFWIGGILPLLMAVVAALWLPESVKYLVLRKDGQERAALILKRLAPGFTLAPRTRLVVHEEVSYAGFSPKLLFSHGLAFITPLLWLCFAINLMGFYFLVSWMPSLLTGQTLLASNAGSIATSLVQIGGTVGGLALCRPLDTRGFAPAAMLAVLAVPCVALIGFAATSSATALFIVAFLAGFCVLGLQFGLNAASAMFYPTAFRSNGSGWAFGVGRFGSVLGPIVGGLLIDAHLSLPTLFLVAAVPFAVGALACLMLTRLSRIQFKGAGLGEREAPSPAH